MDYIEGLSFRWGIDAAFYRWEFDINEINSFLPKLLSDVLERHDVIGEMLEHFLSHLEQCWDVMSLYRLLRWLPLWAMAS